MATWNGVITNAGNSLLNEWVNEKALNFDSAAAGQGTVAAAAIPAEAASIRRGRSTDRLAISSPWPVGKASIRKV